MKKVDAAHTGSICESTPLPKVITRIYCNVSTDTIDSLKLILLRVRTAILDCLRAILYFFVAIATLYTVYAAVAIAGTAP